VLQLVAEVDGRVIGWLSARIESPEDNAAVQFTRDHGWTRLVVDALIVDADHWGPRRWHPSACCGRGLGA